jgi:hypothetical protein
LFFIELISIILLDAVDDEDREALAKEFGLHLHPNKFLDIDGLDLGQYKQKAVFLLDHLIIKFSNFHFYLFIYLFSYRFHISSFVSCAFLSLSFVTVCRILFLSVRDTPADRLHWMSLGIAKYLIKAIKRNTKRTKLVEARLGAFDWTSFTHKLTLNPLRYSGSYLGKDFQVSY